MPPSNRYTLEICVDTPEAIPAAARVADRIELCTGLDLGGFTPDHGLMAHAAAADVETHVLIRGRSGDFTMTDDDLSVACTSIRTVRKLGLQGVVIGAEHAGALDLNALDKMVHAAAGLDLTLHRVIDILDDPVAALEHIIKRGFKRVLTSGGAPAAINGVAGLRQLCAAADGRIEIMAGSGLNSANLPDLMATTPVTAFHASCTRRIALDDRYGAFGFGRDKRSFDPVEASRMAALLHSQSATGHTA